MLDQRVAIVTGGVSGIGRAVALRLAREGADICILTLTREQSHLRPGEVKYLASRVDVEETQRAIEASGRRSCVLEGDISIPSDVSRIVNCAMATFGRIDILVNNAATSCVHPVLDHSDEAFLRVIMVNLFGAYLCSKAVLPAMIAAGWGRVVSIASTSAHVGSAGYSAYTASKHGLLGFSRSLAQEMAQHKITVNTISPGIVETPSSALHFDAWAEQAATSPEQMREHWLRLYPQGRFIAPEEIAATVAFLCSEEAAAINGEDIRVTTGAMW